MKKKVFIILTLISVMLSITPFQGFSVAQTIPGYVGVSEGDRYEWEIKMNKATLDKLIDEMEGVKDDFKDTLGSYGNLNSSEFLKEILLNFTSPFLPDGWESMNITELTEESINTMIEYINTTWDLDLGNWKAMNLTTFAADIIDGLNATDYTLIDVINEIVNATETEFPELGRMLPLNWDTLTLRELMGWQMDNFMNNLLMDATGDTFEIPGNWQTLNTSGFMAGMFPGLDTNFIDLVAYLVNFTASFGSEGDREIFTDIFFEFNMSTMLDMAVWQLNQSVAEANLTLDLTQTNMMTLFNYSLMMINSEEVANMTLIPEDWVTLNLSSLVEEILLNVNESGMLPGVLETNMSDFIEFIKLGINQSIYNSSYSMMTGGELINNATLMAIYEFNATEPGQMLYNLSISNFSAPIPWYELSINNLIDELWNLMIEQYDSLFLGQESELAMLTAGIKIRFDITNITTMTIPPGVDATWVNFTFSVDPGLGEFQESSWIMGEGIYLIDPTDLETLYPAPMKALAFQAYRSMLLFIGKTYDKSKVTFSDMTMDMPDPLPDVILDIAWDANGVLDHASIKYGSDTIISVQDTTGQDGGEIPGYDLILFIGISLSSILGLIYVLRRKRIISSK